MHKFQGRQLRPREAKKHTQDQTASFGSRPLALERMLEFDSSG